MEMYEPQFAVKNLVGGYGLGIEANPRFGAMVVSHGGGGYGYLTTQKWIPEYGIGVVVLTNQVNHPDAHYVIADETSGSQPSREPSPVDFYASLSERRDVLVE